MHIYQRQLIHPYQTPKLVKQNLLTRLLNCAIVSITVLVGYRPKGRLSTQSTETVEAGVILGIELLDHVIINAAGEYSSMKQKGVL